ncbi:NAD(P)/FAD-dependent oxidoreductase [Nocardioides perillae]|uniref:Geranylgeranyl reductase family protein n=1 Tax=Nocardioides perillae TaxID=1119534 RepID=A0A7Y9RS32_9ACTN|nr:geranylgeranyl reductase family protein [Nocardioides perillae]NYG54226.1 geranylgeranyl reductase family protein [Nocardioides perillae]
MPTWDLLVVGAGPAGAATALGALHEDPTLRVALVDRADFPRDKACGDALAPHVLDVLAEVGVTALLDDVAPVPRLRVSRGDRTVDRPAARPSYVVPRRVLDDRLVEAAQGAGATLLRHRVREVRPGPEGVVVDGLLDAAVVVGADGAGSVVRRGLGLGRGSTGLALRGYAPTPAGRRGAQVIVFGTGPQPAYAWSFDRGDGLANVGYGEVLGAAPAPGRAGMLERLEELLPGATDGAGDWRGAHLPLSGPRWRGPRGRVLLVGDAAHLVNPITGEGLYYAAATGVAAGRAAADAIAAGDPASAGLRHDRAVRRHLAGHLRHTAATAALARSGAVLDAGLRACARDQRVVDDLAELGLARGRVTPVLARGLARGLVGGVLGGLRPGALVPRGA